jgi:hypothetical protein
VNSRYVSLELSSEDHWLGEGVLGVAWCWFDRLTLGLVRGLVFWLAVGWLAGWLIDFRFRHFLVPNRRTNGFTTATF